MQPSTARALGFAAARTRGAAAALAVPAVPEQERAQWPQLDRGRGWRARMWQLGEQLRIDYPDLAELTKRGWTEDRLARDGLLAHAVWRAQLDTGAQPDPRLKHQWLASLRDFKTMLEAHAGSSAPTPLPLRAPDGW